MQGFGEQRQPLERGHRIGLDGLALDDGLVDLGAAVHVVGLVGEEFLQHVGRAVGFQRPDFHLAEALATELGLAAEGLLGDEAVGPNAPGMDFVVDEVVQLKHVDAAHVHGLLEGLAGHAVVEPGLAGDIRAELVVLLPGLDEEALDVGFPGAVEDGRGEVDAEGLAGPAEVALKHLADWRWRPGCRNDYLFQRVFADYKNYRSRTGRSTCNENSVGEK